MYPKHSIFADQLGWFGWSMQSYIYIYILYLDHPVVQKNLLKVLVEHFFVDRADFLTED